jgi:hypothetical protein
MATVPQPWSDFSPGCLTFGIDSPNHYIIVR